MFCCAHLPWIHIIHVLWRHVEASANGLPFVTTYFSETKNLFQKVRNICKFNAPLNSKTPSSHGWWMNDWSYMRWKYFPALRTQTFHLGHVRTKHYTLFMCYVNHWKISDLGLHPMITAPKCKHEHHNAQQKQHVSIEPLKRTPNTSSQPKPNQPAPVITTFRNSRVPADTRSVPVGWKRDWFKCNMT